MLPVPVKRFDLNAIKADRDQISAEAVQSEKSYGPILDLPVGIKEIAKGMQEQRRQKDAIEEFVIELVEGIADAFVSTEAIFSAYGLGAEDGKAAQRKPREGQSIKRTLLRLGWTEARELAGGTKKKRGYAIGNGSAKYAAGMGTLERVRT